MRLYVYSVQGPVGVGYGPGPNMYPNTQVADPTSHAGPGPAFFRKNKIELVNICRFGSKMHFRECILSIIYDINMLSDSKNSNGDSLQNTEQTGSTVVGKVQKCYVLHNCGIFRKCLIEIF